MANGYKTGGRRKGTPNKITSLVRESLTSYVQDILNTIDINKLEDTEKIRLALGVMQYILPKKRAIEDTTYADKPREITIQFVDANGIVKTPEQMKKEHEALSLLDTDDYGLHKDLDNIING